MQRLNFSAKSIVPRIITATQKNQQCRKMGGHGGNHASAKHGHSEPYGVKHGKDYSEVAYPFGIVPGTPLQGWEIPTYSFYFIGFMICFVGIGYCKKDTTFTVRKCIQIFIFWRRFFFVMNDSYCCKEFRVPNLLTGPFFRSQILDRIIFVYESPAFRNLRNDPSLPVAFAISV